MDHRARFTRIIAAMAVIAATTLVGLPGIASAAPGEGSISGTVFDDQGSPLPNVCVYVQNYGSTTTDPFGTYSLTNIPVGQYRIQFSDCNDPRVFVTQWYLGQPDESTAQYVDVYDQMDTSLNNVSMQPGVSVTGTVTDTMGNPIQGIDVRLDAQGPYNSNWGQTDANGQYRTGPVVDGNYKVRFDDNSGPPQYAGEYWNDRYTYNSADQLSLSITNGTVHSGIDAQLAGGATISGNVHDQGMIGVAGICVNAYLAQGQSWDSVSGTMTDANGDYTLYGLPPTQLRVDFNDCTPPFEYLQQWYSGAPSFEQANNISLNEGDNVGGIDATLVAGVNVSGNVTDESGNALQNVNVSIDAVNGGQSGWAQTDSNGNYTTTALPVGDYRVRFDDSNHDYAIEFWNNASTYDSANQLHIDGSGPVTGINAQLPLGARISGTVTGPNGAPAPNICVGAIYGSGDNPESTGWAQTNAAGQYEMRQLPAGPHRVRFEDCNDTGPFLDQWYDGTQNMEDAAVINLSTGSNQPGVDVELALAAQIRGKVTNTGGAPLGGICVQATTDTFVGGMGHSQGDGTYSIRLPLGGTYKVQFVDCGNPDGQPPTPGGAYLGKWWGGGLEPSTAQTVSVAAGGTVNDIDAVLSPSGGTGTISGRITNVRGEGLQACVVLFLPTQHVRFAPTDGNGNYSFTDVPTGTWNLGFLGCGQEDVSPVIPDAGNTGVFFNGVWYDGVQLQFTNDSPDPIAQGANLITVHPNESISANACMGCKSVTVKPPVIGDDYILVDFGDLGLTTTQPGAQSSAATLSYSVKCSSSTGKPTSATQTSYPVRVSGFTPGEPYVCSATVLSGDTEVGASASFAVTVGKRASSPTNSTGTTPAPGTRAFGPAAATPDAPDSASDSASGGAKPAQLAFTGSNLVSMVALATLMILLGAGITTATLRRHVRDKQAT